MNGIYVCYIALWSSFAGLIHGLTVRVDPNVTVLELQPVNVTCSTDYTDEVTFRWTSQRSHPDFQKTGPQLWIDKATTDVAGRYECTVVTKSTPKIRNWASMFLTVLYKPKWQHRSVRKFGAAVGDRCQLSCIVHSNPQPPMFYWVDKSGTNMSISSSYSIFSSENSSILTLASVRQADYGNFACIASNMVGSSRFQLSLLPPGVPDSPLQCFLQEVANTTAVILCYPGYSGGQDVSYVVSKAGPFVRSEDDEEAEVKSVEVGDKVKLSVSDLSPATNYTLLVYAENSFGRSPAAFTLYAHTKGKPLPVSNEPNVLVPVVGGVVGGAAALLLIILIVTIVICRRKHRRRLASSRHFSTAPVKYNDGFEAEDNASQGSVNSQVPLDRHRSAQRYNQSSGLYDPSSGTATPVSGSSSRYVIDLGHHPGESDVGYENVAFTRGSGSMEGSVHFAGMRNQEQLCGPSGQPSVAGHGAIQGFSYIGGYSSSAADRPPPPQNIDPLSHVWAKPYSDQHSTSAESSSANSQSAEFQPDVPWEFPREKLYIRQKIGEGSFGEVWKAKVDGILGRTGEQLVAVKMLRDDCTQDEFRCLQRELDIMKRLQPHPNIIALLGCCTKSRPLCVVMELATNGSLQRLLRQQRKAHSADDVDSDSDVTSQLRHYNLTSSDLLLFAAHVANGMEYVASQRLLHRDLAARNILLDDKLICKISDFGFARDIIEMRQYESKTQKRLPIRWMAPESLMLSEYSTKSDVWSFGVLLWEIITLASTPYPGLSGPEVMEFVEQGRRMKKPRHCTDELYAVMMKCWHQSVSRRPTFSQLKQQLTDMFERQSIDRVYVDQMVENTFDIISSQPGEKC